MEHVENDLISIVVPIYNVELYLEKCVESIINQTYKNIEILLIDDGSTDNCGKICDLYSKKDSRIKVYHKKNGGLSDARNYGIERATGKYITFIDSDDYVETTYVEYLYNLLQKYNCNISFCTYFVKYDNGKEHSINVDKSEKYTKKEALKNILYSKEFEVSAWAKMYLLDLFNDVRYPKGKVFEDIDTTYKLIDKEEYIACGYKAQYNYMIRNNSITNTFKETHFYMVDATKNMCSYISERYPDLKPACDRRIFYAYISTLNRMIASKYDNNNIMKDYKNEILNKSSIFFDKDVEKRDKIAIISLKIGLWFYRINWNVYKKVTGRS